MNILETRDWKSIDVDVTFRAKTSGIDVRADKFEWHDTGRRDW